MISEQEIIKNALKMLGSATIHEIRRLFPGLETNLISGLLTKWQLEGTVITNEKLCDVKKQKTIAYSLAKEMVPPPVSPSLLEELSNLVQTMPEVTTKLKELETLNDSRSGTFLELTDKFNGLYASIILLKQDIPLLTNKIKELENQIEVLNKKPKRKRRKINRKPNEIGSVVSEAAKILATEMQKLTNVAQPAAPIIPSVESEIEILANSIITPAQEEELMKEFQ